jgi:hypothetical protein
VPGTEVSATNQQQTDHVKEDLAGPPMPVQGSNFEAELMELSRLVQSQQAEIKSLQQRLQFVLSFLDIKDAWTFQPPSAEFSELLSRTIRLPKKAPPSATHHYGLK